MRLTVATFSLLLSCPFAAARKVEDVPRLLKLLGSDDHRVRAEAFWRLVGLGDKAAAALRGLSGPPLAAAARRALFCIRWGIDRRLDRFLGPVLAGFDRRHFRRRIEILHTAALFAGTWSYGFLRAVKSRDPHPEVRSVAARLLGEVSLQGALTRAAPHIQAGKYQLALREINEALKVEPRAPYTHLAIARIFAQWGKRARAFAALERALELGFTHFYRLENDPELRGIRATERFRVLIRKYRLLRRH